MRVWPLIIFLIVECTIPEFPEQGQSGYEQLPSWLKGWYHLPFQLLRVITPGILWFTLRLYKPLTARCESAFLSGKIEKSETAQERTRQTDGGEKRLGTFADLTIRSYLEALQASRLSRMFHIRSWLEQALVFRKPLRVLLMPWAASRLAAFANVSHSLMTRASSRPCQSRMSLFFPAFSEKGKTGRIPDESFQKNVQKRTKGRWCWLEWTGYQSVQPDIPLFDLTGNN